MCTAGPGRILTSWWGCRLHSQHGWLPIWPAYGAWPDARVRACDPEQAASRSRAWCHPRRPSLSRWRWRRTRHGRRPRRLAPPLQTEAAAVGCAAGCVDGFLFQPPDTRSSSLCSLASQENLVLPSSLSLPLGSVQQGESHCGGKATFRSVPHDCARLLRMAQERRAPIATRHGKESPLPLSRFSSPPRAAENRRATSCSAPPRRRCPCPLAARIAATASPPRR